jgi:aminoglycoside/choline kinase family phosphotransferase
VGAAVDDASRKPALEAWLAGRGLLPLEIVPLTGDVSTRRYYRLRLAGAGSAVLAVYPPDDRDTCRRFLRTTALLEAAGVRVPVVLADACDRGWMVVEDLGEPTLFDLGSEPWERLVPYYRSAVDAIGRIERLPAAEVAGLSPPLDEALLRRELGRTWEVLLVPRGLAGGGAAAERLRGALDRLAANLAAADPLPCHRDLMPRNLAPLPGGAVGLLDHQDLRLGPPRYDLASLLNDSLFPPPEVEEELLGGLLDGPEDRLRYHRAAAQRTLKAAGTFAAFAARSEAGSDRHLRLVGPTLRRALAHLERLPETAEAAAGLAGPWRTAALLD